MRETLENRVEHGARQGEKEWERKQLFGMPVDVGLRAQDALARVFAGPVSVSYLNPYAWRTAGNNRHYTRQLESMDLVHCDGIMVQRAVHSVFGMKTPIVSLDFSGIGRNLLEGWSQRQSTLCLVGGTEAVVEAAGRRVRSEFPGIRLVGTYNGYGDSVSSARTRVLDCAPDALLVAMGMGRQEAFLCDVVAAGWRGAGVCVGALFDRLANPRLDYPEWSTRRNMRFAANLMRRPLRYARRYGVDYAPFYWRYLRHLISLK